MRRQPSGSVAEGANRAARGQVDDSATRRVASMLPSESGEVMLLFLLKPM